MLCDKCGKNNATVHYEQNINGEKTVFNLCSECAKKYNIGYDNDFGFFDGFSFDNMFKGFFGNIDGSAMPKIKTKRCPACSTSFDDIINSCKVGCSECYDTFRDEIESAVRKFQPSAVHRGKVPNGASPQLKKTSELERLTEKLKKAVANEEYEQAVKLRDEIKKLRGEE